MIAIVGAATGGGVVFDPVEPLARLQAGTRAAETRRPVQAASMRSFPAAREDKRRVVDLFMDSNIPPKNTHKTGTCSGKKRIRNPPERSGAGGLREAAFLRPAQNPVHEAHDFVVVEGCAA